MKSKSIKIGSLYRLKGGQFFMTKRKTGQYLPGERMTKIYDTKDVLMLTNIEINTEKFEIGVKTKRFVFLDPDGDIGEIRLSNYEFNIFFKELPL